MGEHTLAQRLGTEHDKLSLFVYTRTNSTEVFRDTGVFRKCCPDDIEVPVVATIACDDRRGVLLKTPCTSISEDDISTVCTRSPRSGTSRNSIALDCEDKEESVTPRSPTSSSGTLLHANI